MMLYYLVVDALRARLPGAAAGHPAAAGQGRRHGQRVRRRRSQAAFGARGGATVLSRATTVCAVLFMVGALLLGIIGQRGPGSVIGGRAPAPVQSAPASSATQTPAPAPTTPAPAPAPPETKDLMEVQWPWLMIPSNDPEDTPVA